ncbi:MAG: PKD domain-containing protein [Vicingaceae bacterium]
MRLAFLSFFIGLICPSLVQAQVLTSVNDGLFLNPLTWDCTCIPSNTDTIVIESGDTVTLSINTTVGGLEIRSDGLLDNNGNRIEITDYYHNDGEHTGNGDIWLTGTNTNISGNGVVSNGNDIEIRNGNKNILAGTDLYKTGGGQFIIRGALTVTNHGSITSERNINGNNNNSTWINDVNSTVEARRLFMTTGDVSADAVGNEVIYARTGNQNIILPITGEYYNLTIGGSSNKNLGNDIVVLNDLELGGGSFNAGANTITLGGDFTNSGGLLNEGTSKFILNGNTSQTVDATIAERFNRLEIDKSAGNVVLNSDIEVRDSLILKNGLMVTGNNKLTLGISLAVTGFLNRTSGHVVGNIERWINTTATPITFPVGSSGIYRPALVTFNNLTGGKLNIAFNEGLPGDNGLPLNDGVDSIRHSFTEGYWEASVTSLSSTDYDLEVIANGFSSYTVNPSTRIISRSSEFASWQIEGKHALAVAPNVFRDSLSAFPRQFAIGDTTQCTLPKPVTSIISGLDSVCGNTSGVNYSVVNTAGASCDWTITGGSQSTGGNTSSITVDWGPGGITGEVAIIESNGCEYGSLVQLAVDLHPLPADTIIGLKGVEENSTGVAYSTTPSPGYTYNWTITGGSQASGGNSANITVDWGSAGTGNVALTAMTGCGTSSSIDLDVNIYALIKSVTSDDWDLTTTWDCSCVPSNTSNVEIQSGHTVTLVANTTINSVIVLSGATLDMATSRLDVRGDLTNGGAISGTNRLTMQTSGNTISGSGSWLGQTGILRFNGGTYTIDSDVNLVKTAGNLDLRNNSQVFNNGNVNATENITGQNANASWYNLNNASLTAGNSVLVTGRLYATSPGNTVTYARGGNLNQTIKNAVSGTYHHLVFDGTSTNSIKSLGGNIIVNGDLTVLGSTFDVSVNNRSINLKGNWNNSGGVFIARNGTVTLGGSNQLISNSSQEVFNNLVASGSGTKTADTAIAVQNNLIVNNGVTLDMHSGDNNALNIGGDMQINGSILLHKSLLTFDGSAAQQIDATVDVYDMLCSGGNNVAINSGAVVLSNSMELTGGSVFNSNNSLTFLSDVNQTAYIKELNGGSQINGSVTVQRFLNEDVGYYMLGSPVTGATLDDWNQEIITAGFPGSNRPTWKYGSVYTYDETARTGSYTTGYQPATNVTNSVTPGQGWYVYLFNAPKTIDVSGPLHQGSLGTGTLSHTSTGPTAEQGWHLVANPYASPILWSDVNKTNIQANEAYVRRADVGGNYWSVNGDGIDTIYSAEGFWVQAASGGGSLTFDEADKIDAQDDYNTRAASPLLEIRHPLKMTLTYSGHNGYQDYSVLQFGDTSNSINFDGTFGESRKLGSTVGTFPNIASISLSDTSRVYFNSLSPNQGVSLPLEIWTLYPSLKTYNYQLEFDGIKTWNENNHCLVLTDSLLMTSKKLEASSNAYSWAMNDTLGRDRIYLQHSNPIQVDAKRISCFGANDAMITAKGFGNGPHTYTWLDENGDTLFVETAQGSESQLVNLSPGKYTIHVSSNGICGDMATSVEIVEGEYVNSAFTFQPTVLGANEFRFDNQSLNANKYLWDFGDGNTSIEASPAHIYKKTGSFKVKLVAYGDQCADTSIAMVDVSVIPGISREGNGLDNLEVFYAQGMIHLNGNFDRSTALYVRISNSLGQVLQELTFDEARIFNQTIQPIVSDAFLIVEVRSSTFSKSVKIFTN